jgi:Zn ribbon nucleic-acid-binding protein
MDVILKVQYTQEYNIRVRDVDSVEQAKNNFDECEDLDGEIAVYGYTNITDGFEVTDCPDCDKYGNTHIKDNNGKTIDIRTCKKCGGEGFLKKEENNEQQNNMDRDKS